jgi:hypothetical protein
MATMTPDRWIARPRGDSSSRRHFVECERETRRAIAAGERDMLAQHTDESFRADEVSFRNAGGAVVQVLMRSDFFATEAFFCDHGRHLPGTAARFGGLRVMAPRITSSGTPHCSAIESNTAPSQGGTARHQEKPDPPWARLFRAQGVSGATASPWPAAVLNDPPPSPQTPRPPRDCFAP